MIRQWWTDYQNDHQATARLPGSLLPVCVQSGRELLQLAVNFPSCVLAGGRAERKHKSRHSHTNKEVAYKYQVWLTETDQLGHPDKNAFGNGHTEQL